MKFEDEIDENYRLNYNHNKYYPVYPMTYEIIQQLIIIIISVIIIRQFSIEFFFVC